MIENKQQVRQSHNGFWFSFYGQGYYFSVGYFAYPKNRIRDELLKNLC